MFYTLVYLSYPSRKMTATDLDAILQSSRRNNPELDITGILMFSSSTFIQVLEGEKAKVKQLYDRITKDERHVNAYVVFQGDIEERGFSEWSMGFKLMKEKELNDFKLKNRLDNPQLLNNLPALTLMEAFYELL